MPYYGDYQEDSTNFSFKYTTRTVAGVPSALTWTTGLQVYRDEEVAQSTAGITHVTTFDSIVGLNHIAITLTDAFYVTGSNYSVVITSGTVNSVSVAGETLAEFSIENRFSTQAVTDALTNYGVSTVSSASQLDIATTALETYGATTLGTTEFVDANTTALETHGASTVTSTDINDEVLDVMTVDQFAEPAQGAPDSTATFNYKIGLLYKSLINKKGATSTSITLYNDDAATVDHKRTITGSSTFYDEEEFVTGP